MELINRGVVVIKPKPPFHEWVNSDPTLSSPVSMENLHQDCTAILVPDLFGPQDVLDYLEPLKPALFEMELEAWNLDPITWPSKRTNEVFDAWFELEVHSMVWDSVDAPIGGEKNGEELSIMNNINLPFEEHAFSRYLIVSERVIDQLQRDYFAGRELGASFPNIDATEAAVIVAESLEADQLLEDLPDRLSKEGPPEQQPKQLSDWSLATMAELFFEVVDVAREDGDEEAERHWWALGYTMLEEVSKSPTASPLLWYEDIYFDLGQELRVVGEREAVDYFKRALAHSLHHDQGANADALLLDLAETYLWVGELDRGLRMFAAVLRNDPSDIWAYNVMALSLDRFGLADLGVDVTRRGLELIKATQDPERLHDQFVDVLENMGESEGRGRETQVSPDVLAELRAALALDFEAGEGRPIAELCRELVPDLDQVPVKHPPEKPDLPPPDEWAGRSEISGSSENLGRNDPCWCGSGKKYKHCHMRSDQGE
jgi:tetratricopeptide (TPR) repeat protein